MKSVIDRTRALSHRLTPLMRAGHSDSVLDLGLTVYEQDSSSQVRLRRTMGRTDATITQSFHKTSIEETT